MYSTKSDDASDASESLADSESLRQENPRFGSWLLVLGTQELWWSDEVYHIFGVKQGTPVTRDIFFSKVHPKDRVSVKESISQISVSSPQIVAHRIIVGGRVKWVEEIGHLYLEDGDVPSYVIGIIRETDNRKNRRRAGDKNMQDMSMLQNYLEETANITSLQEIVKSARRSLQKILGPDCTAIFINRGGQLKSVVLTDDNRTAFMKSLLIRLSSVNECMSTGKPVFLNKHNACDEQETALLKELGAKLIVSLPIKTYDTTIAVLTLAFSNASELSCERLGFCETFCSYLSIQLQNALLYEKFQKETTKRKRVESDFDTIFTAGINFIAILGKDGYFKKVNQFMICRLGYTREELLNRPYIEFLHPEDRDKSILRVLEQEPLSTVKAYRNRFICKNGDVIELEWNAKYMQNKDRIIAFSRDITDQERIKAENLELEKSIAMEKMKLEFFAQLSHEFKTPLNIILSSLQLLKMKLKAVDEARYDKEYDKFFGYMEQNSYKLLRLALNLIDMTRVNNDFLELNLENCDLQKLLSELIASVDVYAAARSISLTFSSAVAESSYLCCDRDKVERIVLNLLSNAIKNTNSGGKIEVRLGSFEDYFKIAVKDTGIGIEPAVLPFIFDKFRVSKSGFIKNCDGSGIGLSIVKSLVEAHKGTVTASSVVGEGELI